MTRRKVAKRSGNGHDRDREDDKPSKLKFKQCGFNPENLEFLYEMADQYDLPFNTILNKWTDYLRSLPKGERTLCLFPEIAEDIRAEIEERAERLAEQKYRERYRD